MKISGIYQIKSLCKPERIYIGSAVNIHRRWTVHLCNLKSNIHHSGKLQNHFNKYGKNDLVFSVLIGCDKEDLISTEQYFLDLYKPYFNNCMIAGSCIGIKHSEETKSKISAANKGKILSEVTRKRMSEAGKNKSEETKRRIGDAVRRRPPVSEETKRRISLAKKGKKISEETRIKRIETRGPISDETRERMSEASKGRIVSKETRRKHSEAMKGNRYGVRAKPKIELELNLN